jgi:hypothetical protein
MSGAVFGGVGGRIIMRIVALIDQSAYGVRTDSGATVGEITVGGTIALTIVTILAGIICGVSSTDLTWANPRRSRRSTAKAG